MTTWMTSYCRLANHDPRYAEVHEWCRIPAVIPTARCGCPCHNTPVVNGKPRPQRPPGGRRWVSLGDVIGGPSDAVPASAVLDPDDHRPPRWDKEALAETADWEFREAGFDPQEPFPGTVKAPWPSRCLECGAARQPSLAAVRRGARCTCRRRAAPRRRRAPAGGRP
ncbi:hypothetical protein AB0E27_00625 [Streptomyces sparsogenes]|uniref:hypothetical protein n=1 Tax=Streptomyces sparsogenes TaxID=67365 RepID=UPI003400D4B3